MKITKPEYLEKVQRLSNEEKERLLSRMAGKLPRRLEKDKLSVDEALAMQLEIEDEQLQEWRSRMQHIKDREKAAADDKVKLKKKEAADAKVKPAAKAEAKSKAAAKAEPAVASPKVEKKAMPAAKAEKKTSPGTKAEGKKKAKTGALPNN